MSVASTFFKHVAIAQDSKEACRVGRSVINLRGNPCCEGESDWGRVDLFLYWPLKLWLTRCKGCGAVWTENADPKKVRRRS